MNPLHKSAEWDYRVQERLGILCGSDKPTKEQEEIARREADAACETLWGGQLTDPAVKTDLNGRLK